MLTRRHNLFAISNSTSGIGSQILHPLAKSGFAFLSMVELLILGAEGSGKSLLIRKLKQLCTITEEIDEDQSESTIPTIGVDISSIEVDGIDLTVREIGGSMASKWHSYIPDSSALLFVIDVSDLGMLASNLVLLYEVVAYENILKDKSFAILFNKMDLVSDPKSIAVVYNTLRIDDLRTENNLDIVILSGSSLNKEGSSFCVRAWIQSCRMMPAITSS